MKTVTINNESFTIMEFSELTGISYAVLNHRVSKGDNLEMEFIRAKRAKDVNSKVAENYLKSEGITPVRIPKVVVPPVQYQKRLSEAKESAKIQMEYRFSKITQEVISENLQTAKELESETLAMCKIHSQMKSGKEKFELSQEIDRKAVELGEFKAI